MRRPLVCPSYALLFCVEIVVEMLVEVNDLVCYKKDDTDEGDNTRCDF